MPSPLPLNTAVFWDIENLLGGYGFIEARPGDLSLAQIQDSFKKSEFVGGLAVQRAYANWSDSRLATLRTELNELGIEPVQVFGFSNDPKKNAADIQLVIDVLELTHSRPAITSFVIVSGDGGFSALIRMLHQHSRSVVSVAYEDSANATLKAICDTFVPLRRPNRAAKNAAAALPPPPPEPNANPLPTFKANLKPLPATASAAEIVAAIGQVLRNASTSPSHGPAMKREGINFSVLDGTIRWLLTNIGNESAIARCGFSGTGKLILAATDAAIFAARYSKGDQRLFSLGANLPADWSRLSPEPMPAPDSATAYKAILATDKVAPTIRLSADPDKNRKILERFFDPDLLGLSYNECLAKISSGDGTMAAAIPIADVQQLGRTLVDLDQINLEPAPQHAANPTPGPLETRLFRGLLCGTPEALAKVLRQKAEEKLFKLCNRPPLPEALNELLP